MHSCKAGPYEIIEKVVAIILPIEKDQDVN